MSKDNFSQYTPGITAPIERAAAVTPDNAVNLPEITRAIYIGGAGNLVVTLKGMEDGTSVTLENIAVGAYHAIRAKRVWADGTTATGIVAGY